MQDTYFAANPDSKEAVSDIQARIKRFRDKLARSGQMFRMARSWRTYAGYSPDGNKNTSVLLPAGEQGQLVNMTSNHYAGLLNQSCVLITSSRPAFKAIATNSDYSSLAQTQLAEGLLEFYDKSLSLSEREVEATRDSLIFGEGYIVTSWNKAAGDELGADADGNVERAGDIESINLTPFDVAHDLSEKDFDAKKWFTFRRYVSKWDLAAEFPTKREKILNHSANAELENYRFFERVDAGHDELSDCVTVWEFRHIPSPACPNGRLIRFLDAECVLVDSMEKQEDGTAIDYGYPYDELHAYRIVPDTIPGTGVGHSPFFDCIGLQEAIDMVTSITTTAVSKGGLFNWWLPPGIKPSILDIAGGMKLFQTEVKPEAIALLNIPPEVKDLAQMARSFMRERTAINDVVMGEPNKGMPAQAMALLQANAIQFHSKLQHSYQRLVERVRTGIISMLKRYANTKRVAVMAGAGKSWMLKEFDKTDIAGVKRVTIEAVNPASKTQAGRLAMADKLGEMGMVKTPEEYITLLETGQFRPLVNLTATNNARVEKFCEMLREGKGPAPINPMTGEQADDGMEHVRPLVTDTHWSDIPRYLQVVQDPSARERPEVVAAVRDTVLMSLDLWRQQDPALTQILGGFPAPPNIPPQLAGVPMGPPPEGAGQDAPQEQGMARPERTQRAEVDLGSAAENSPTGNVPGVARLPQDPVANLR